MWERSAEPAGILLSFETHPWTDLLRWKQTRTALVERLRQVKEHHKTSILNYVVLPDCVTFLTLPASCQTACKFAGQLRAIVATDYWRRSGREGPFWKGKLQCTLVLGVTALQRCLEEMIEEPVRRELVLHTCDWQWSGYAELVGLRRRYRVANYEFLRKLYSCESDENLHAIIAEAVEEMQTTHAVTMNDWMRYTAIGSRQWINAAAEIVSGRLRATSPFDPSTAKEQLYALTSSTRSRRNNISELIKRWDIPKQRPQA